MFKPFQAEMIITHTANTCALLDSCSKETINGCVRRTADGLVIGLTVNRYVKRRHKVYVVQTLRQTRLTSDHLWSFERNPARSYPMY